MKLTTKRNRWYFWRELFSYMIPIILIVWTVDVFLNLMQCSSHPEWSVPCSIIRILALIYWTFLVLAIIFAIISANMLRKVKRQIENEFLEATVQSKKLIDNKIDNNGEAKNKGILDKVDFKKKSKPKKIIVEWDSSLRNKHKAKKTTKKL